ncbi:MAG: hypothetical protein ACE5K4_09975 [Candidatus Hydrothermarchaeota archaeon]
MHCEFFCVKCKGCIILNATPQMIEIGDDCSAHAPCEYQGELEDPFGCLILQAIEGMYA